MFIMFCTLLLFICTCASAGLLCTVVLIDCAVGYVIGGTMGVGILIVLDVFVGVFGTDVGVNMLDSISNVLFVFGTVLGTLVFAIVVLSVLFCAVFCIAMFSQFIAPFGMLLVLSVLGVLGVLTTGVDKIGVGGGMACTVLFTGVSSGMIATGGTTDGVAMWCMAGTAVCTPMLSTCTTGDGCGACSTVPIVLDGNTWCGSELCISLCTYVWCRGTEGCMTGTCLCTSFLSLYVWYGSVLLCVCFLSMLYLCMRCVSVCACLLGLSAVLLL